MLKPADNPPLWPDGLDRLGSLAGDWFVAHTKARNEKAFAWDLVRRGVPHFLPMVEKTTFSGGRKRRNLHPVFGGYVFFNGTGDDRHTVMTTGRLCQVIAVPDPAGLVVELEQLRSALLAKADLSFYPHLALGRRVRVTGGPMRGVVGTVADRRDEADGPPRIVLSVTMLGVGAAVAVEPELLAPADEAPDPAPAERARSFEFVDPPPRLARAAGTSGTTRTRSSA